MNETLAALLSVTLGAVLAFLSNYLTEKRRWEREQKKELLKDKREAISQSLRWMDPMKNALTRINSVSVSFVKGNISHEELIERWPNLVSELANLDVRHDLIPLLPDGTYKKGHEITRLIDEILPLAVDTGQSFRHSNPEVQNKGRENFQVLNEKLNRLQDKLDDYEETLREQYLSTYDY